MAKSRAFKIEATESGVERWEMKRAEIERHTGIGWYAGELGGQDDRRVGKAAFGVE
jgi:hypothetical protein